MLQFLLAFLTLTCHNLSITTRCISYTIIAKHKAKQEKLFPELFDQEFKIQKNTLHNTKRLGPFLVFGYNSGEKQNRDILILSRR